MRLSCSRLRSLCTPDCTPVRSRSKTAAPRPSWQRGGVRRRARSPLHIRREAEVVPRAPAPRPEQASRRRGRRRPHPGGSSCRSGHASEPATGYSSAHSKRARNACARSLLDRSSGSSRKTSVTLPNSRQLDFADFARGGARTDKPRRPPDADPDARGAGTSSTPGRYLVATRALRLTGFRHIGCVR
jgi:hypothetical protein